MLVKSLSILFFIISVSSEKFRFDNYTLYKVIPKNVEEIQVLQNLQNSVPEFDFWDDVTPVSEYVNVLSKPELKGDLESFLSGAGIDFVVTLENIQDVIDKETKKHYTRSDIRSMTWESYYTLEEIYAWLDDLVAANPGVASIIIGGKSHEGRDIKGIKISHGTGKRVVFIESGIHAREWIAPATTNYIINQLLSSTDEEIKTIAHDYDWYIFPVTNPDGYVWSHVGFRLWRKNRSPYGSEFGVDLNRNWNDNWLKESVSIDPTSNVFAGLGPFSEIETRTLSTYIMDMADRIDLYLSFHSSGQILLLPYGNTTEPLANYHDAMQIGRRAMGALSVRYGTQYTTGNIAEAIYFATGTSVDWVKERLHVPLVYCYELRDRGTYGHLLPPEQILPTSEEVMDSIVEMIIQAKRFGYMNYNSASTITVSMTLIFAMMTKLIL
ncbi:zinc carboxypeptidase-like [Anticarsia gemmatalis]|uniref:zinc carboxypeptidase-like n=1 Tax=Anticarsia gemmatalis TaxID=129554 RepID=UPI003F759D91